MIVGAVFLFIFREGHHVNKKRTLIFFDHHRRLNGEQAFMLAEFLETVVMSLWRELGDDMADFQGRVFPDDPPSPYTQVFGQRRRHDDDDHL